MKNYRYEFGLGGTFAFGAKDNQTALQMVKAEASRLTEDKVIPSNAVSLEELKVFHKGEWVFVT